MRLNKMKNWRPPAHWMKITTVDVHTEGEPLRIITGGLPDLPGENILARRCHVREKLVKFIQKNYPQALPKTRAEFHQLKDEETA